jgi:predicted Zn-dependent peptidase
VRPYDFPEVERATLENGLRLVVAPMHRLPIVTVLALVDAGASVDPRGAEGVAALTARALAEGSGTMDGVALIEAFEALGTTFEASADWDGSVARVTVLPAKLEPAVARFSEVVRQPSFPEREVLRLRDERLADLAQVDSDPRALAEHRFTRELYQPSARFALPLSGARRSVGALSRASLVEFHATRYRPEVTTLIVVGDCTVDRARRFAEANFADWRVETPSRAASRPSAERAGGRRTVLVRKRGAQQAELRVGHVGVPRSHPDHLAIVVMNAVLGGLFGSRLNLSLREKHAFTYGASSGFDWRRDAGPFGASAAVKSEVTAQAVTEILREIDQLRAVPPTGTEVSLATEYLAGVFPIRFETTAAVAGAIAGAITHGLSEDWFARYRERILHVDTRSVHAAARAHLDPDRLLVLAVGDGELLEAPLRALACGPMQVRDSSNDEDADV